MQDEFENARRALAREVGIHKRYQDKCWDMPDSYPPTFKSGIEEMMKLNSKLISNLTYAYP